MYSGHTHSPFRAVIIEDETDAIDLLTKMLSEFVDGVDVVGIASTIPEAIRLIKENTPDLLFLDIQIEDGNTFELLEQLGDYSFQIIFTTAYEEYAIRAFKNSAVDYLLKPYSPVELIRAIDKARNMGRAEILSKRLESLFEVFELPQKSKLKVMTSEGQWYIAYDEIVRLEADRSYCTIHIFNGDSILVSKPLLELEKELPERNFFRCHSGHIINLNKVKMYEKMDGGSIIMDDGSRVPLARRRKDEFFKLL